VFFKNIKVEQHIKLGTVQDERRLRRPDNSVQCRIQDGPPNPGESSFQGYDWDNWRNPNMDYVR
jgi:hypothetical protein